MLNVKAITKKFLGLVALNDVSITMDKKQIYGLIGPNGSGKTTLLNVMTGFLRPTSGLITIDDKKLTGLKPYQIAKLGIGRTFQLTRMFSDLTVEENVLAINLKLKGSRKLDDLFETFNLQKVRNEKASVLSYAERKLLEIIRTLSLDPSVILLDEPLAGLDIEMIKATLKYIRYLNRELGKTLLITEHNLDELLNLADYIFVLHEGKKVIEGPPASIKDSSVVRDVYFGK